jgi:hypothetical protein
VVTAGGIIAAGGWALFVFVPGRSSAGIVWLGLEPKYRVTLGAVHGIVVSVTVKGTGRTRVEKVEARIQAVPLANTRLNALLSTENVMAAAVPSPAPLGTDLFTREVTTEAGTFASIDWVGLRRPLRTMARFVPSTPHAGRNVVGRFAYGAFKF